MNMVCYLNKRHLLILIGTAADPDALQEVERGLRWYLKIGGGGQWLELSRLKYPHRAKGRIGQAPISLIIHAE